MTLAEGSGKLAYKAYEIEEWIDVYFFRRIGYVMALAARSVGLSPNSVSILAGIVGAIGGALIAHPERRWLGVVLFVSHGAIDSADGQLARMTGQSSTIGRILDGLAGYVTHIGLYGALFVIVWREGWGDLGTVAVLVSGLSTMLHAQWYDYHRTAYAAFAIKGRVSTELVPVAVPGLLGTLGRGYAGVQQALLGLHTRVVSDIVIRSSTGQVMPTDQRRYREFFYRRVCWWNLLGDNVRRYGVVAAVAAGHPEWFVILTVGPLNVLALVLWLAQQRADRRFLVGE
jgi:phosphatidylglycerophosphate synthase